MDIDRELLIERYKQGDLDYFFKQAYKISDFVISGVYKIYDKDKKQDMQQECMENLWKKVQQGKVNPNKNLFAFVWKNTQFRILEILRKEKRRNEIAQFSSYDDIDGSVDTIDNIAHLGDKYMSIVVKELSTVQ